MAKPGAARARSTGRSPISTAPSRSIRKDSFAWFNRGITYSDKGDPEHAIADYNQAIRLNSRDAWYYNNRGNSYGDISDFGSAMADYDQAIKLDPKFALAYFNRGTYYRNHGHEPRPSPT